MRKHYSFVAALFSLVVCFPLSGNSQSTAAASSEISADLGSCSALIAVTDNNSKPLYGAKINTRVQYGLLGVKKLDLEAFTGADGKVKIVNLPDTLKKPMYIHITKDEKEETVEFKPSLRCHATFDVQLH